MILTRDEAKRRGVVPQTRAPRFAIFWADGEDVWEHVFSDVGGMVIARGWVCHVFGCEPVEVSGETSAPPEVLIAAGVEALRRTKREASKKTIAEQARSFLKPWRAQGWRSVFTPKDSFDELVVGNWLHVEVMDRDHVWMRVGPLMVNVTTKRGAVKVRIERDGDGEVVVEDGVA